VNFQKHYTRDEARSLLPKLREWLDEMVTLRDKLAEQEQWLMDFRPDGADLGGEGVNRWVKLLTGFSSLLFEFRRREIQIKDLDRGLVDFPAMRGGKEVFLCWQKSEDDIGHWHDLDSGFAGREPL
jgi:hypothetical protein